MTRKNTPSGCSILHSDNAQLPTLRNYHSPSRSNPLLPLNPTSEWLTMTTATAAFKINGFKVVSQGLFPLILLQQICDLKLFLQQCVLPNRCYHAAVKEPTMR